MDTTVQQQQPAKATPSDAVLTAPSCAAAESCAPVTRRTAPEFEVDTNGVQRLKYAKGGWNTWRWSEGYNINYVQYGMHNTTQYCFKTCDTQLCAGDKGPPLVLVHGFGASAYHYRYNIPALAQSHRVYAIDLLGFGFSDKPVIDYNSPQYVVVYSHVYMCTSQHIPRRRNMWADEIVAFVQDVVLPECEGARPVLAGNSLGGYNVLSAAAQAPDIIRCAPVIAGK